ncbi:MAG: hypothetical protein Q9N32_00165 [Gammaproteobacteria bacterium]|nr:hypothetical protein [Gammaproteobacteria bacterium]
MMLNKKALAAMMLLVSAGCNAEQEETTLVDVNLESFQVAVADGGPYAAPLPAGAKAKQEKPKKHGVKIYIPGQDDSEKEKVAEEGMVSDIGMSPRERVASTPKGKLKNPFTDNSDMAIEGHARFMGNSCNGCHGGTGGGGMCPPLSNEVFGLWQ